jgi:hypothetical protein
MKKNIAIGAKPKKKSIPININSNPAGNKFLFSNQVNPIASSYLSMGQKIQISKNLKNSKIIQVNTNSAVNYYTLNSKDSKQISGSVGNSVLNNYQSNNVSENNGINFNNFYTNNSNSQQHYETNNIEKNVIKYNNINLNSKGRKHLSTISNSILANDLIINGCQTSKNNNLINNNNKSKNKIVSTNSKNNISKIKQTYSTRPNFLDSKNKTKKIPMKSKIRQYKYQFKNGKPVSTSFSNVHIIKNNGQGSVPRNIYNYVKADLLNNISNENNRENFFVKNNTNGNFIINSNNLYDIKNKHCRHNTASFDNKDIINIFNKNNFSDKTNKNINNLNIKNVNQIGIKSNNSNICINNIDSNNKNINISQNKNLINKNINNINNERIIYKINNGNFNRRKSFQYSKGKISNIKIYVNEKKINQKDNKFNKNINQNNNVFSNNYNNNFYNNYYTNNINNNMIKDNYNNAQHHMKNSINIPGIKKISVKQKEVKKNNIVPNQTKLINKQIQFPAQKMKGNNIPSQRNIKINLTKFLEDVKNKQNNKMVMGRKSLSIKRMTKENNSDFSLSQLNDKFTQKILKNNEEGNDIGNCVINNKQNINKTLQEEIKIKNRIDEEKSENNKINDIDNILIDTNYISNMQNKANANRISSVPTNVINDICQNNENIAINSNGNINYNKVNYNANAYTTNNNYYGKNKSDYSIDNIPDLSNNNLNNKEYLKNKENINDININKVNDNDLNNNKIVLNKNIKNENINSKKQYTYNNDISSENNKNISVDTNISKNNDIKFDNNPNVNINNKKIIENTINNNLFDEDNLNELPEDYDENFNDLYSIINKMNFGNVLVCVEGLFTPDGRTYKKYKEKFDKFYDKLYSNKKGNSFANSNNKPKKVMEGISLTSNTKTNSSSSKKNIINPMYNDLNIVKDLNIY